MTRIDALADRIAALEDLARTEGLVLPMPASVIAQHELLGAVVDLRSGVVIPCGADMRLWPGTALCSRTDGGKVQP